MSRTEYGQQWRANRRAKGLCFHCPNPARRKPDGTSASHCDACAQAKIHSRRRRYVQKGSKTSLPQAPARAGLTTCLWCQRPYESPDAVNDRYHPRCRHRAHRVDVLPECADLAVGDEP